MRTAIIIVLLGGWAAVVNSAPPAHAAELWVAPDGNDANPGTRTEPLAQPARALRKARELRRLNDPSVSNGVQIILREGTYQLTTPLLVRPEDSGTETSPTIIRAATGESPVLSGGVAVTGWRKLATDMPGLPVAAQGKVWVADAPVFNGRPVESRQLWVNNRKAVRAREPNGDTMARLWVGIARTKSHGSPRRSPGRSRRGAVWK